jgi:hypothetical protein
MRGGREPVIDEAAVQALLDKQAITEAIYTYCRAVDRLDVPLGHSIWHADATADYGAGIYQGPGKGVIDLICAQHAHLVSHSHQVTNILIKLNGTRAGSEAYMTGTMRLRKEGKLLQMGVWARYLDSWQKHGGIWAITRRTVVFDHEEVRDVTPMGQTLNATRDTADPSYAVLGAAS